MKKILAIILCIATIFSLFSFAVNAEDGQTESETEIVTETPQTDDTDSEDKKDTATIIRSLFVDDIGEYFTNVGSSILYLITSVPTTIGCLFVPFLWPIAPLVIPGFIYNFFCSLVGLKFT